MNTTNTAEKEFLAYCYSFYGRGGIYHDQSPMTKKEIEESHRILKALGHLIKVEDMEFEYSYDSFGREMVRDICTWRRGGRNVEYDYYLESLDRLVDIKTIRMGELAKTAARLDKLSAFF